MKINSLPVKELKVMIMKMFIDFGRRMDEHSMNFNNQMENVRKYLKKS